jgi:hypothetical protein
LSVLSQRGYTQQLAPIQEVKNFWTGASFFSFFAQLFKILSRAKYLKTNHSLS